MSEPAAIAESQLRHAIEDLYEAFEAPTPRGIEGCPCCIDTRNVDVLLSTPLREISGRQLWRYVTGLFLTVGSERDFRYFMPRMFELEAADFSATPGAEIALGKLKLAEWRSWPGEEQRAVEAFVEAWIATAIEREIREAAEGCGGGETESVLCGAARAGIPADRWLTPLRDPNAAPLVAELRERGVRGPSGF